jgi:hypothetical protein
MVPENGAMMVSNIQAFPQRKRQMDMLGGDLFLPR